MTDTTAPRPARQVVSVRGGKVHDGETAYETGQPWPRCRTGAQTNSGTRYTATTLPVTCTACARNVAYRATLAAAEAAPAQPEATEQPADAVTAPTATVTVRATGDDGLGTARRALVLALVAYAGGTATVADVFVKGYKAARHYDITLTGTAQLAHRVPLLLERSAKVVLRYADQAAARAVRDGVTGPARARMVQAARREALADLVGMAESGAIGTA